MAQVARMFKQRVNEIVVIDPKAIDEETGEILAKSCAMRYH